MYGYISFGNNGEHLIFDWLSFFMVPFFINSGFLFYSNKKFDPSKLTFRTNIISIKNYLFKKSKKLLCPWIFWFVFSLLVYSISLIFIFHKNLNIRAVFEPLFYTMGPLCDTPLWFLWSLFCVNSLYYIFNTFFSLKQLHCLILISFLISFLVQITQIQFLGIGNICLGLFYYHVGRIMNNRIYRYLEFKYFILALFVYIIINICYPQYMAFVTLTLTEGDFFTNTLFSLIGSYLLWYFCFKIRYVRWINFIGVNSLVLFVSHRVILNWVYDPVITHFFDISYILYILGGFAVIIPVFVLLNICLQKYIPFAVGKQ